MPLLAKAFLQRTSPPEIGKERLEFSPPALRALERHAWPGNVRELENRVKRAVIMAEGRQVHPADLELERPRTDRARALEGGARSRGAGTGPAVPPAA